jgi:hypothetical protein
MQGRYAPLSRGSHFYRDPEAIPIDPLSVSRSSFPHQNRLAIAHRCLSAVQGSTAGCWKVSHYHRLHNTGTEVTFAEPVCTHTNIRHRRMQRPGSRGLHIFHRHQRPNNTPLHMFYRHRRPNNTPLHMFHRHQRRHIMTDCTADPTCTQHAILSEGQMRQVPIEQTCLRCFAN